MKLSILKETARDENRVAATPETVKKLAALGLKITVQSGAGTAASYPDTAYKEAGAKIAKTAGETVKTADIVFGVQAPKAEGLKKGAMLVGMLNPHQNTDLIKAYATKGVDAFAMELVPRITRAQGMDVLSSQSNLAGYKAVLEAANAFGRAFPMMMTAAGTIPPARVFVMGAGVAGLQAIATARRLGATVSATDVRPAAREQVQSLGASFVMVESDEVKEAETSGGYAKEMSKTYQKQQAALITDTIKKQDIVITTALIPGRAAPILVTAEMVKTMKPGSVIVDMAVEQGGNCELSTPGEVVEADGVKIIGYRNLPGRIAEDASALYARNLLNFLTPLIKDGKLEIDREDEIITGCALTQDGKIIHPQFKAKKAPAKKKKEAKK